MHKVDPDLHVSLKRLRIKTYNQLIHLTDYGAQRWLCLTSSRGLL